MVKVLLHTSHFSMKVYWWWWIFKIYIPLNSSMEKFNPPPIQSTDHCSLLYLNHLQINQYPRPADRQGFLYHVLCEHFQYLYIIMILTCQIILSVRYLSPIVFSFITSQHWTSSIIFSLNHLAPKKQSFLCVVNTLVLPLNEKKKKCYRHKN